MKYLSRAVPLCIQSTALALTMLILPACQGVSPTTSPVALAPTSVPTTTTATTSPTTQPRVHNFAKWEKAVAAFEAQDKIAFPPKGAVLFVGSSTVVRWKTLAGDFPTQTLINRGFGGNEIVDSTHFADRMIFPYEPRKIFLIAGSNDISAGDTPEQVAGHFREFVQTVHAKLPDAHIYFVGLNPRPKRWAQRETNRSANVLIEQFCRGTKNVTYIETYDMTITPDGQPIEGLFVEDRLHFNEKGYQLLADRIRKFVEP